MQKRLLLASTCFVVGAAWASASYGAAAVPAVADGLSGTVTSAKGPEAGVWVIAETKDLPTRFIKIVVTDDQGRYVVPQLPKANYKVWVRGYGLVDSKSVAATPGKQLNLTAVVAPDAKAAARYYPANYWYALIRPPAAGEFPGTGPQGNGIAPTMKTQQDWLLAMKERCVQCHQLGDQATRELANNSVEGWSERVKLARPMGDRSIGPHGSGYAGAMSNNLTFYGPRGVQMFADWTQRLAKGELPPEAPPRPTGIERNLVLTVRDWAEGSYVHDEIATDRRNPMVNPNGPIYGSAANLGKISVLDPVTNKTSLIDLPGSGKTDDSAVYPHTPVIDQKGRMWSSNIGKVYLPSAMEEKRADYCSDEKANKFAKYFPYAGPKYGPIIMWDNTEKKLTMIPSCSRSHHLAFTRDKDNTMYFTGDSNVIGWIKTNVWDQTHDAEKSQGWCPMVLDTNGDGKITPDRKQWNDAGAPPPAGEGEREAAAKKMAMAAADPTKDTRVAGHLYGMDVSIVDNTVWLLKDAPHPGGIIRFDPGSNPPETCKSEYYQPPLGPDGYAAFNGRGISLDSKGIVWVSFGTGQMGRFERAKCKVTNGPTAIGQQCPEGWTFYDSPGPKFQGVARGSADFHYLSWVDLYDTLGMGKDVPMMMGTNSDSLLVLTPGSQKFTIFRVPYPMGFYSRGVDGRIDDPKTGWKGRGLWATYSDIPTWHQEDGEDGSGPELVQFQLRPDPLAF